MATPQQPKKSAKKSNVDIEMSDSERLSAYSAEIDIGVQLCAFLAAVAFFFSGLLVAGNADASPARSVSLALLFGSAFGFLFSALFYSNASGKITVGVVDEQQIMRGNVISEYIGVYGLVLATPLAIYSYSKDEFLGIVLLFLSCSGIFAYQVLTDHASILERYFSNRVALVISTILILTTVLQFVAYMLGFIVVMYLATSALWGTIAALIVICWRKRENRVIN